MAAGLQSNTTLYENGGTGYPQERVDETVQCIVVSCSCSMPGWHHKRSSVEKSIKFVILCGAVTFQHQTNTRCRCWLHIMCIPTGLSQIKPYH